MVCNKVLTFVALVARVALRAALLALSPLVVVARLANRKSTNMARDKRLPVLLQIYLVSAYITSFAFQRRVCMSLNHTVILLSMHISIAPKKKDDEEERKRVTSWRPWEPV